MHLYVWRKESMNNVTKAGSTEKKTTAKKGTNEGAGKAVTTAATPRRAASKTTPTKSSGSPSRTKRAKKHKKLFALAAYLRAEQRGFMGGDPVADWLEAEAEIDSRLSQSSHYHPRTSTHAVRQQHCLNTRADGDAPSARLFIHFPRRRIIQPRLSRPRDLHRHLRLRRVYPLLDEGTPDIGLQPVLQLQEMLSHHPHQKLHVERTLADVLQDEDGFRLFERERVCRGEPQQQRSHSLHVLLVGDVQLQIETPDRKFRERRHLGFDHRLVRDAHIEIVESAQLHREEVDRQLLARGLIDLDHVAHAEGPLADEKKAADEVGGGGLRGEADRHRQDTRRSQQHAQAEAELAQRGDHEETEQYIIGGALQHHALLRVEVFAEHAQQRMARRAGDDETDRDDDQRPSNMKVRSLVIMPVSVDHHSLISSAPFSTESSPISPAHQPNNDVKARITPPLSGSLRGLHTRRAAAPASGGDAVPMSRTSPPCSRLMITVCVQSAPCSFAYSER